MDNSEVKPSDWRTKPLVGWVSLAARLLLGGCLLYAGLTKIVDLKQSVIAVRAYEFPIPDSIASLLGYGLPIVEILLGLAIVVGLVTRWVAALGGASMIAYIAAIISVWARGLSIDCGCFTPGGLLGPEEKTKYAIDILRDLGLLLCAVWIVLFPNSRVSLDSWLRSSPDKESQDHA